MLLKGEEEGGEGVDGLVLLVLLCKKGSDR